MKGCKNIQGRNMNRVDFLKKIPYFKGLSDQELEVIANVMREKTYPRGYILFHEGEFGEAVHFVMEGRVKIYKVSEDGREHILYMAIPGDIFAEVILFNEVNYPATAEVMEDTRIAYIRNEDLENVLANPAMAVAIIKVLNKRLMDAQHVTWLFLLSWTPLKCGRLRTGSRKTSEGGLDLNMSRQELPNMVGMTQETVTRCAFKV